MTAPWRRLVGAVIMLLVACGGGEGPGTGAIEVSITSGGAAPDPDGYQLVLDDTLPLAAGPSAVVTVPDVPAGSHRLRITGLKANCYAEPYVHPFTVPDGGTAEGAIHVSCPAPLQAGLVYWASFFQGPRGLFQADSSGQQPAAPVLPFPNQMNGFPVLSRGRTRWLFTKSQNELVITDLDGGNEVNLTARSGIHAMDAGWSADGDRVMLTEPGSGGRHYVMYADGSGARRVIRPSGSRLADWSPDGRYLLFIRNTMGGPGALPGSYLERHDLETGATVSLFQSSTDTPVGAAAFTPDGLAVLFGLTGGSGTSGSVHRVPASGGTAQPFIGGFKGAISRLTWSLAGTRLAILADSAFVTQVYVAPASGASHRMLTAPYLVRAYGPYWTE